MPYAFCSDCTSNLVCVSMCVWLIVILHLKGTDIITSGRVDGCESMHARTHTLTYTPRDSFNIAKYFCFRGGWIKQFMLPVALSYFPMSLGWHWERVVVWHISPVVSNIPIYRNNEEKNFSNKCKNIEGRRASQMKELFLHNIYLFYKRER